MLNRKQLRRQKRVIATAPIDNTKPIGQRSGVDNIRDWVDNQPNTSPDARMLALVNIQLLRRLDQFVYLWESQQHILARAEAVSIATTQTLVYENTFPYPVSIEVYNLDPAQTCFVGRSGLTVHDGLPILPEQSHRYTLEPGDRMYGRVAAGAIDIRFSTTMRTIIM